MTIAVPIHPRLVVLARALGYLVCGEWLDPPLCRECVSGDFAQGLNGRPILGPYFAVLGGAPLVQCSQCTRRFQPERIHHRSWRSAYDASLLRAFRIATPPAPAVLPLAPIVSSWTTAARLPPAWQPANAAAPGLWLQPAPHFTVNCRCTLPTPTIATAQNPAQTGRFLQ